MMLRFLGIAAFASTLICQALAAEEMAIWKTHALEAIQQKRGVERVSWKTPGDNVLWVDVQPDTYHSVGFARYLCTTLDAAGLPPGVRTTIWIFDPAAHRRGGWPLGDAKCVGH